MTLSPLPAPISPRPTLQLAHHRTHEGNHYAVHKNITVPLMVNPKYIMMIPPPLDPIPDNTAEIHLIFEVTSYSAGFTIEMFEGADAVNGAELIARNYNRNRPQLALTHVYEDPTVNVEGTKIFEDFAGTNLSGGGAGEINRDEDEFILKTGLKYLFKITTFKDNLLVAIELNWYDNRPSTSFV